MAYEVIYVCNSINNKNVRRGELNILKKHESEKYFEFGENEMNIKKRFYNDVKTLNKDFDALMKLKNTPAKPITMEKITEISKKEIETPNKPKIMSKKYNMKKI